MNVQPARKLSGIETQLFGLRWLAEYLVRYSARTMLSTKYRRTTAEVIKEYEGVRRSYFDRFCESPIPLEKYLVSEADDEMGEGFLQVMDGKLYSGALVEATKRLQQRLIDALGPYRPESVIEFGCGVGRNLLAIKRAYPHIKCIGLELTRSSVELARRASQFYGLELEIHHADVTKPVNHVQKASVCFSVCALEQIPDSRFAFEEMYRLSRKAVVLFEPIIELYGRTPRDIAARIRACHLDRLRGLYPYILGKGHKVSLARLLGDAENALNPTVELHVLRQLSC